MKKNSSVSKSLGLAITTLVGTLGVSFIMVGCGATKNVAADYQASRSAGSASSGDAQGVTPPNNSGPNSEAPAPATPNAGAPQTPMAGKGDAAKGKTLLATCGACHTPGGPSSVVLNAAAISRLDTAITGPNKANHLAFKSSFEQPNRADLEAALSAIN